MKQTKQITDTLTRRELKQIRGGMPGTPGHPSAGTPGKYQCCWNGTENCSPCIETTSVAACPTGSTLKPC